MSSLQVIAIIMPLVLLGTMYPVFQWLGRQFGDRKGWFIGLAVYWVLWGIVYPALTVGWADMFELMRLPKFDWIAFFLMLLPIIFAAIGRFNGQRYERSSRWEAVGLLGTSLGNGGFEEVIWRGTFMLIFPNSIFMRILYPSIWFGLWHFAPGSLSKKGNTKTLASGAIFLGLLLSALAYRSDSIWWCVAAHSLAGLVMVL